MLWRGSRDNPMNGVKKQFLKISTLMKLAPIQRNRLKTWPLWDFDMLKPNVTSKPFESATQTSKWRKTTSNFFFNPFTGLSLWPRSLLAQISMWARQLAPLHLASRTLATMSKCPYLHAMGKRPTTSTNEHHWLFHAQNLIVVGVRGVNSKMLTSNCWFSPGLISNNLI